MITAIITAKQKMLQKYENRFWSENWFYCQIKRKPDQQKWFLLKWQTYIKVEFISHVGKINIFLNIQKQNHEFQFYSPEQ